jgi:nitrite reductase (NADH) small subunit
MPGRRPPDRIHSATLRFRIRSSPHLEEEPVQTPIRSHDAVESTTAWTAVCAVDGLEPLWGEAALIDGVQIALVLLPDGSLYAVSNQDPVTGSFVMSRGIIGSRGSRPTVASPLHKQIYDLETGQCLTSAEYALRTFPVRVMHGTVEVLVRDQSESRTGQGVDAEFVAA